MRILMLSLIMLFAGTLVGCGGGDEAESGVPKQLTEEDKAAIDANDAQVDEEETGGMQ